LINHNISAIMCAGKCGPINMGSILDDTIIGRTLPSRHAGTQVIIMFGYSFSTRRGGIRVGSFWCLVGEFCRMCIIKDYLLKGFSDLCVKDTLIKDVI
jgi:hypothetical protein